jgi:hypothetical protein
MKSAIKGAMVVSAVAIVMLLLVAVGCQTQKIVAAPALGEAEAISAKDIKKEETKKISGLYDFEPAPLRTVAQCAQCHVTVFDDIKKQGGKHQIECVRCHTQFHMFNPKKRPYETVIPKCETCHGVFHGKGTKTVRLTNCAVCHADPHAPLIIPSSEIENACSSCHQKEDGQIKKNVSRHTTEVACVDCHADKHGFIPECNACHESHSPGVDMNSTTCMGCHPVHMPTKIAYSVETSSVICAGCHDKAYDLLQKNHTKHTDLTCAKCHDAHKKIPDCGVCHGQPHSKTLLKDKKCGDCHGIAHNLPS